MLVAALAAAVAISLASAQSQWSAQVAQRRDQVQAQSIALAGIQWTRQILDAARAAPFNHLGEPWAMPLPATPVENGSVEGRIVDAQGMLSVNNLASGTTYYCRGSSVAPAPSGWSSPFSVTTGTVPPTPNPTTVAAMGAMQTQVAAAAADQQTAYNIVQSIITGIQTTAGKTTCGGVAATTLTAGQYLASGQQIFSPNGKYRLRYQPDANFVLYLGTSTTVLWATNKYLGNPGKALMQSDGNLVTYNGAGAATWATGTYGRTGVWLALQDDGNLVLYQGACTPIWHR